MVTDTLTIETQPDKKFGCTDIVVKLNESVVFNVSRFERPKLEPYSSTFWNVNKDKSKEDYLRRLAVFYEAVRGGNCQGRPSFKPFVYLTYGKLEADASVLYLKARAKTFTMKFLQSIF